MNDSLLNKYSTEFIIPKNQEVNLKLKKYMINSNTVKIDTLTNEKVYLTKT